MCRNICAGNFSREWVSRREFILLRGARECAKLKTIALAAFPKSGVTYLSSLLFYSFFPTAKPEDIERSYVIDIHGNPWETAEAYRGRIFLKTHFAYPEHVKVVGRPEKAVYLVRDPVDIMNSAYDFHRLLDSTFAEDRDSFVDRWIASGGGDFDVAGPWIHHADSWTKQPDVPVLILLPWLSARGRTDSRGDRQQFNESNARARGGGIPTKKGGGFLSTLPRKHDAERRTFYQQRIPRRVRTIVLYPASRGTTPIRYYCAGLPRNLLLCSKHPHRSQYLKPLGPYRIRKSALMGFDTLTCDAAIAGVPKCFTTLQTGGWKRNRPGNY
jgi:hypothetical protein